MPEKDAYRFTDEILQQVKSFQDHLQSRHLNTGTIRQKTNYAGYFLKWLESERLQPQDTRYNDLLNFIDSCRLEGMSKTHVNRVIASIRDYYSFLKNSQPGMINPATGLYLKGHRYKVVSGIIGFNELETLYQTCQTGTLREKRNKIILGLLIYQGVTTEELSKLEPAM